MLLVINNYDSFTYNLVHYAQEMGANTHVIRNDDMSANEALNLGAKAVLISPGPKTPDEAGMCLDLLAQAPNALPILGICLGQQSIGQAFGGKVIRAKQIMHGKVSEIHHDNTGLFEGLDNPFKATRYHSLSVERESLPDCLAVNETKPASPQSTSASALKSCARIWRPLIFRTPSTLSAQAERDYIRSPSPRPRPLSVQARVHA